MLWRKSRCDEAIPSRVTSDIAQQIEEEVNNLTEMLTCLGSGDGSVPAQLFRSEIEIAKLLGKGSFCHVYEVNGVDVRRHESTIAKHNLNQNSQLALKIVNPATLKKGPVQFSQAATDLAVEAAYLSKLNHPSIIKLVGVPKEGSSAYANGNVDSFFILTERITETLSERISKWKKKGKPKESMIPMKTLYGYQIASALRYLHDRRIVFRDLKPQNVGFQGEAIKLFDFGLCTMLPSEGALNDGLVFDLPTCGTPRYSSPEMLSDRGYNLKTDVYSWALVFYEILTHETVFSKLSLAEMYIKVCVRKERPSLSRHKIPKRIERLLRKSWGGKIASRLSMDGACKILDWLLEKNETSFKTELSDGIDNQCNSFSRRRWAIRGRRPSLMNVFEKSGFRSDGSLDSLDCSERSDVSCCSHISLEEPPAERNLSNTSSLLGRLDFEDASEKDI